MSKLNPHLRHWITASSQKLFRPPLVFILSPSVYPHLSPWPALNSSSLITSINNLDPVSLSSTWFCYISSVYWKKAQNYEVGPVCLWHIPLSVQYTWGSFIRYWALSCCPHNCLVFHSIGSNLGFPSPSRYLWSKTSLRALSSSCQDLQISRTLGGNYHSNEQSKAARPELLHRKDHMKLGGQ